MSLRLTALENQIDDLQKLCRRLIARHAMIDDRLDKMVRHGKVTDVDTKKQLARIEIGNKDGTSLKSAWVPYAQSAGPDGADSSSGEFKFHNPPVVGQQMTMLAPNGEFRQAMVMPFTWYDKAASPSQNTDEKVVVYGTVKLTIKKDQLIATVGGATFEVHSDFIRGQIGSSRFVTTSSVSKIRNSNSFVVVTAGQVIVSSTPVVGADPDGH